MNNAHQKFSTFIRYLFGIVLVIGSTSEFSTTPFFAIFALLFGISLIPALYDMTPLGKVKNLHVILPVCFFIPVIIFFYIKM